MKYKNNERLLCKEDFIMDTGERSYTKGKIYIVKYRFAMVEKLVDGKHSKRVFPYEMCDDSNGADHGMNDYFFDLYFTRSRATKLKRLLG